MMKQLESLPGPSPDAHSQISAQPTLVPSKTTLGYTIHRGVNSRGLLRSLRSGGRVMVAASAATSLAICCGRSAFLPAMPRLATAASTFSTQTPSSIPKPGFAPGAPGAGPPPPGSPPATMSNSATTAFKPTLTRKTAPPGRPSPTGAVVSIANASDAFGGVPVVPSRKSRWGWAIPIVGLPLLAAYYTYEKEYDKEWDNKVEELMQEFVAQKRELPKRISTGTPPPPSNATELARARTPPQPSSAAPPEAPHPPTSEPVAQGPGAVPAPPPPPPPALIPATAAAPEQAAAAAAVAAPPPPPPPGAALDTEAAGAILCATEAVQAAQPQPPADVATAAAVETPATASAARSTESSPPPPPQPTPALSPEAAGATATAAALALLQTDAVPSSPLPSALPAGKLGLEGKDLSPLGLIQHAVTSAGARVTDWSQWPERYAQAVADSKLIFEALTAAAKWHEAQMAEVRGELATAVQHSQQLQSAGEAAVQRFKELLKQVVDSSKEMLELEVRQAEKRTRLESEKVRLAEAVQRGEQLEQLRLVVGALSLAHEARVRQAAAAQTGHVLAAGAAAVGAAAESGAPLGQAAAALRGVAVADPLVGSVVSALPEGPVSTRSELLTQFRRLRGDLSALSYLPGHRAGIVAVAVARMAARLKVDESEAVKVLDQQYGSGGIDAALARTEALLVAGKLPAAAELLAAELQGTAAEAIASDWLNAVRRRAAAEASVTALNAHAAVTWASIA